MTRTVRLWGNISVPAVFLEYPGIWHNRIWSADELTRDFIKVGSSTNPGRQGFGCESNSDAKNGLWCKVQKCKWNSNSWEVNLCVRVAKFKLFWEPSEPSVLILVDQGEALQSFANKNDLTRRKRSDFRHGDEHPADPIRICIHEGPVKGLPFVPIFNGLV